MFEIIILILIFSPLIWSLNAAFVVSANLTGSYLKKWKEEDYDSYLYFKNDEYSSSVDYVFKKLSPFTYKTFFGFGSWFVKHEIPKK